MPTGYTADIYEGKLVTFPEFVMRCARAIDVLITMRDEPHDAIIPEKFEPSDYHEKAEAQARARLAEVEIWSPAMALGRSEAVYNVHVLQHTSWTEERRATRERYQAMLAQVRSWTPPSPQHLHLKTFMVEQIEGDIDLHCAPSRNLPKQLSGPDYQAQEIAKAQKDIEYHSEEYAEEVERANGRTAWVRALRESLEALPEEGE